jgi:protein gp37
VAGIDEPCRAAGAAFFFEQGRAGRKQRVGRELFGRTFDERLVGTPPQRLSVPLRD